MPPSAIACPTPGRWQPRDDLAVTGQGVRRWEEAVNRFMGPRLEPELEKRFRSETLAYGAYILIPISLRWQTAAALLLSAGGVVLWLLDRFPVAEAYESVAVLAAYTLVNVWGLLSSSRIGQSHRRRFVLLTQEKALRQELETALAEVKVLRGIIPICSFCNKIRNDDGYYEALEAYISRYSEAHFSHTLCPDCFEKHYPDVYKALKEKEQNGAARASTSTEEQKVDEVRSIL